MESGDVEQSLLPKLSDSNKRNSLQRRKSIHHEIFSRSLEHNDQPRNGDEASHQRVVVKQVSFRKVFVVLATYLGGGTLCFFLVGDQINGKKTNGIVDAIYFCVVTMTTVGYGDLVPNSIGAKLLACAYVFTGITLGGMLLSRAADYIVEKQEILLVKAIFMSKKISSGELLRESVAHKLKYKILMTGIVLWVLVVFFLYLAELRAERRQKSLVNRVLSRDLTYSDLEEADLDHDKVVSAAEFVVYKLKEMGKINQEDVSPILDTFYKLDIDQSGNLTEADLVTS
ncbi:two-pore potassium channel 1-like isoform X2 [Cucurbita maxima]|uniref:Two-pore potassium channel 1-like isoform X2 n=1 Tax=Cucurbita maxima TaxID=3661 RepID=A0A6J1HR30_CUCMA|nr:two-pore potassium channel 1-like isoform X2 [Cucurbita maxima]